MLFRKWPIYDQVLASLTDGSAISGLLIDQRGDLIVLANATLFSADAEPQALDGEIYIERSKVLYLQVSRPPA